MLEEDLRSPCTEEIAVFHAFAQRWARPRTRSSFSTRHRRATPSCCSTRREAYHREVSRTQGDSPESVRSLLPRCAIPAFTRVLLVTLAEATPVHEAARSAGRPAASRNRAVRLGHQSEFLASGTADPVLSQRAACERPFIERVERESSTRCALIAWQIDVPVGAEALSQLAAG